MTNEAKRSKTKRNEATRRCAQMLLPPVPSPTSPESHSMAVAVLLYGSGLLSAPCAGWHGSSRIFQGRRWLSYCCLCIATVLVTYGSGTGIALNSRAALWLWCCMVLARLCLTACGAASALATKVTTHGSTAWSHGAMGLCHSSSAVWLRASAHSLQL